MAITFGLGIAVAAYGAAAAKGKPGGGCTPASSRVAFNVYQDGGYDLFAVNPDGTCLTRLTNGGSAAAAMAWTADNHILVGQSGGGSKVLSVPNSSDPTSVTTAYSYARTFDDISQHRDSSGVLPVGEQLLIGRASDGLNLEACTADGTTCTQLTNYVSTYVDGGTGTTYVVGRGEWLPPSADRSRIRLEYDLTEAQYVDGVGVSYDSGMRVITLDTGDWPSISTAGMTDTWIGGRDEILEGYRLGDYSYVSFSRDGSRAVLRGPWGDAIYMLPVLYDEQANTVTVDVSSATAIASSVPETIYNDLSLSPDNGKVGYNASHYVGKGASRTLVNSIFTIGTNQQSGSVEVDGQSKYYACCTAWGP